MIYGMYRSAAGIITSSHATDVIANNLANVETNGFKRQMATFGQMKPQGQVDHPSTGNPFYDQIGSGPMTAPSAYDFAAGGLESTGNTLDLAVLGEGYFAVEGQDGSPKLTRNGEFMLDREGYLRLATEQSPRVLDVNKEPIRLEDESAQSITVSKDGELSNRLGPLAQIGVFKVDNPKVLQPIGQTLFQPPRAMPIRPTESVSVLSGALERSNVDPALEMTRLMQAQRQLEANANMIRYQDQATAKLVTDVGRIG